LNLLLDTHVFLWLLFDDAQLGADQRERLKDSSAKIFLSSVSIFEVATKARSGKLIVPPLYAGRLSAIYNDFDYVPLSVSVLHAELAGNLVGSHKDPFDRLLAAQSIVENMPIMTVDMKLRELGAEVVW
jgi:PIN domain nuclease of toxin-antitoxin system